MREAGLELVASRSLSALDDRRGVVRVHPEVLSALGARPWDPLLVQGRRATGALAALSRPDSDRRLLLCDALVLANAGAEPGALVAVKRAREVEARSLRLLLPAAVAAAVPPDVLRLALLGKVVTQGDAVSLLPQDLSLPALPPGVADRRASLVRDLGDALGAGWPSVEATVVEAHPAGPAVVTMGTVVLVDRLPAAGGPLGAPTGGRPGDPVVPPPSGSATFLPPPGTSAATAAPGYDAADAPPGLADLPGLEEPARRLREVLEVGFHGRDLLRRLGGAPRMGVLVTGPAGSGKGSLVRAVAAAVGAEVTAVRASALAAEQPAAVPGRLQEAVQAASRAGAAVLLLEDVDVLAPRDADDPRSGAHRTAALDALRGAVARGDVAVVCTTSRPEATAPELRSAGLLDVELALPLPDRGVRQRLLEVATHTVPLAADVDLADVAGRTPGFVRADLIALVREATVRAAARHRSSSDPRDDPAVHAVDLDDALDVVRPSSTRDVAEVTGLSLDDVGDMVAVKEVLTEAVVWPLAYPDTFARLGVDPPRGILLHGPPGCGKTFLVRALAGSAQVNVLSVKGAELLTKWVGESERAVRELFRRARQAAPCLVFLDEVDALAPPRGRSDDTGTSDRVVAALLTELDGVEALRDVVVVGATNRPELVDPALLRPGRLGRSVHVPPPDAEARALVLVAAAKGVPLADDVDLAAVARGCEGFSAADLAELVREAAYCAMRESMAALRVTAAHVAQARASVRPSLTPEVVRASEEFAAARA